MIVMSWFAHGGSRIYYEQDGQGEPVLVLPGWAGGIGEFEPIRQWLAPHFRVIAADLPGSGQSEPQPREYTPTYFRDDAETFLAMLDHEAATTAHLIGFSDGGEVALLMAAMRPDAVRSVVAWGAAGQLVAPPGMLDAFYNLINDPIPPLRDFAEYLKATYGDDNARAMTRSVSKALRAIIEAGGDISRSHAQGIACPVLLLTGEHDPFCPPGLVSALASEIPRGEFVRVDEVGHDVHTARPEWLAETVTSWLQQLRVDGPSAGAMGPSAR
jgi:pimeloyl-ACP methyl ester carboxylesterase